MPFHDIGAEQLMALEQLSEIFHRVTNTSKDNTYTPYTVHPISIPERIKTVDTTPPLRVQEKNPTSSLPMIPLHHLRGCNLADHPASTKDPISSHNAIWHNIIISVPYHHTSSMQSTTTILAKWKNTDN
eukprot:9237549-Ditylum_brightwellii.AAC.1